MGHETYLASVVGVLFATLVAVLSWIGAQINRRLDLLTAAINETNRSLMMIDKDLRSEVAQVDRRLTKVESLYHATHVAGK